jgi:hypothetical protein
MTDRSVMPVLLDGVHRHRAANSAFKALGLKPHRYRKLRKQLRRWGVVTVDAHTLERIESTHARRKA